MLNYWWHGPNIAGTHRLGRDSDSSGDGDGMEYYEQGLSKRKLKIEDLFHPSTLKFKDV